jgi:predicted dinucleotide-binding enzyme
LVTGAKVAKAFTTTCSPLIQAGAKVGEVVADTFYCGDDDAKTAVASLARDVGFNPIDIGPLTMARYLEALAVIMIQLRRMPDGGPDMGYKLLRR